MHVLWFATFFCLMLHGSIKLSLEQKDLCEVCGSILLILAIFQFSTILTVEINVSLLTARPIFSSQCTKVYESNLKPAEVKRNCSF